MKACLPMSEGHPISSRSGVRLYATTTYLAVLGIHIVSCEIDEEHHVVDFVSHTWQIIHFISFFVRIIRYSFFVFKN